MIFLAPGRASCRSWSCVAPPWPIGWPRGCLCGIDLAAPFWSAFPRIHGLAWFVVALGVAARLVPALERHAAGFRRLVRFSFPIVAGLVLDPGGVALGRRPDQGVARGDAGRCRRRAPRMSS